MTVPRTVFSLRTRRLAKERSSGCPRGWAPSSSASVRLRMGVGTGGPPYDPRPPSADGSWSTGGAIPASRLFWPTVISGRARLAARSRRSTWFSSSKAFLSSLCFEPQTYRSRQSPLAAALWLNLFATSLSCVRYFPNPSDSIHPIAANSRAV